MTNYLLRRFTPDANGGDHGFHEHLFPAVAGAGRPFGRGQIIACRDAPEEFGAAQCANPDASRNIWGCTAGLFGATWHGCAGKIGLTRSARRSCRPRPAALLQQRARRVCFAAILVSPGRSRAVSRWLMYCYPGCETPWSSWSARPSSRWRSRSPSGSLRRSSSIPGWIISSRRSPSLGRPCRSSGLA